MCKYLNRIAQGLPPKPINQKQNPPGTPKVMTPEVARLKKECQHYHKDTLNEIKEKAQRQLQELKRQWVEEENKLREEQRQQQHTNRTTTTN